MYFLTPYFKGIEFTFLFYFVKILIVEDYNEYIKKYQGRVELYDLFPKASVNQSLEVNNSVESFKPAEVPFKDNNVLDNNSNQVMEPIIEDKPNINNNKEPGFVSYVLLGVLVAVLSLVFLYMLL